MIKYTMLLKRAFDLIFSLFLFLCLTPLLLPFLISIWLIDGSPIFFVQDRSGIHGKKIKLYKLRTYKGDKITHLGPLLRKLRIDEIPQLLNVIKGDLSIVGPRPLFLEYNELYSKNQKKRLLVKPGITGLAQIKGLNHLSWKNKFKYDVFYVEKRNFIFDCYIILNTFTLIIKLFFVTNPEYKFASKFEGNKKKYE